MNPARTTGSGPGSARTWRSSVSSAGGQFLLCYRHHPDYRGKKPTHELIERLHREHLERQAVMHGKLDEIRQHLQAKPPDAHRANGPGTTPTTIVRP